MNLKLQLAFDMYYKQSNKHFQTSLHYMKTKQVHHNTLTTTLVLFKSLGPLILLQLRYPCAFV